MSDIEQVKSRLDIVDVVSSYLPLKKAGHSYKGNCPFHKEKTPSFIVTPDMQRYKCFGCGEGGDVLNFIQKIERLDFAEALALAAEKAGYQLTGNYTKKDPKIETEKKRLAEMNELAAKYWHYILKTHKAGKPGRNYLQKRQIRKEELEKFVLGYAPHGTNLVPFLVKKGYSTDEMIRWGLAINRKGKVIDKFRDRFIQPIWNMRGDIVAFSGRIVTPSDYAPKYLNSPETLLYKKSETLMGLYQAKDYTREAGHLILQEGNIDLLSSHKAGVGSIVATGGTALTEEQMKLVKRQSDTVYFAFDEDSAGVKALLRGLELAEKLGLEHKVIKLSPYKDPDELISAGANQWLDRIKNPINTVQYFIDYFQQDLDLGSPDGKSQFVKRMIPVLRGLKDKVQLAHFIDQVSVSVGVTKDNISQMVRGSSSTQTAPKPKQQKSEPEEKSEESVQGNMPTFSKKEIYLLALLIQLPDLNDQEISAEIFTDVNTKEIFVKLQKIETPEDFGPFADDLSDGAAEVLQQVLSTEVDFVEDFRREFFRVYNTLYSNYLKAQILDLRRTLQVQPENEEALTKLQYFTKELKDIASGDGQ